MRIYASRSQAVAPLYSNKPLSMIETQEGFGVLYRDDGNLRWLKLNRSETETMINQGLKYWRWNVSDTDRDFDDDDLTVIDFAVLLQRLPDVEEEQQHHCEYTMVTKGHSPAMLQHFEFSQVGIVSQYDHGVRLYEVDENGVMAV